MVTHPVTNLLSPFPELSSTPKAKAIANRPTLIVQIALERR